MTYNVFCGTLNPTHFTSLFVAVARSSSDNNAIRILGFADDVMFSHTP